MTDLATTHIAQTYLGNQLQNPQLAQRLTTASPMEVTLEPSDRVKGRIYAQTTEGETVGIIKERHWSLAEGDVFQTAEGQLLLIHLQPQTVMVLQLTQPVSENALALIHLGHTLGNHHWPILIETDKIYIQLAGDQTVIEQTLQDFEIPGLAISYELRSPRQYLNFSSHHHHP
ncbi:MAG: urease accessory protein UreE [Cyanobacteria bacterium P01_F01_bin.116]